MINIAKAKAGRKEIRILAPVVRARTFVYLTRFRVMSDLPVILPQPKQSASQWIENLSMSV
jgi:hypothetical protein